MKDYFRSVKYSDLNNCTFWIQLAAKVDSIRMESFYYRN
jgi:hypothetical protein